MEKQELANVWRGVLRATGEALRPVALTRNRPPRIFFNHLRHGDGWEATGALFSTKARVERKIAAAPRGGVTIARTDDCGYFGVAICASEDLYNKARGRVRAAGRMRSAMSKPVSKEGAVVVVPEATTEETASRVNDAINFIANRYLVGRPFNVVYR